MNFDFAVTVVLAGGCLGALIAGCVVLSRFAARTSRELTRLARRSRRAERTVRRLAREQIEHREATTALLVDRLMLVGSGLAREIHEAAEDRRRALRALVLGFGAAEEHGTAPPDSEPIVEPNSQSRPIAVLAHGTTGAPPGTSPRARPDDCPKTAR